MNDSSLGGFDGLMKATIFFDKNESLRKPDAISMGIVELKEVVNSFQN